MFCDEKSVLCMMNKLTCFVFGVENVQKSVQVLKKKRPNSKTHNMSIKAWL